MTMSYLAGPSSALSSLRFAEELEEDDLYGFSDIQVSASGRQPALPVVNPPLAGRLGSSSSLASIAESAEDDDIASSQGSSPLERSLSQASLESDGGSSKHSHHQDGVSSVIRLQLNSGLEGVEKEVGEGDDDEELSSDIDDDDVLGILGLEDSVSKRPPLEGMPTRASLSPLLRVESRLPPLNPLINPLPAPLGNPLVNPLMRPPFRPSAVPANPSTPNTGGSSCLEGKPIVSGELSPAPSSGCIAAEKQEQKLGAACLPPGTMASVISGLQDEEEKDELESGSGRLLGKNMVESESLSDLDGGSSDGSLSEVGWGLSLSSCGSEGVVSQKGAAVKALSDEDGGSDLDEAHSEYSDKLVSKRVVSKVDAAERAPSDGESDPEQAQSEPSDRPSSKMGAVAAEERLESGESGPEGEVDEEEPMESDGLSGFGSSENESNGRESLQKGPDESELSGSLSGEELEGDRSAADLSGRLHLAKIKLEPQPLSAVPASFTPGALSRLKGDWRSDMASSEADERPAVIDKKVVSEASDPDSEQPTVDKLPDLTSGALSLLERRFAQEKLLELMSATRDDAAEGNQDTWTANQVPRGQESPPELHQTVLDASTSGNSLFRLTASQPFGREQRHEGRSPRIGGSDSVLFEGAIGGHTGPLDRGLDGELMVTDRLTALGELAESLKEQRSGSNASERGVSESRESERGVSDTGASERGASGIVASERGVSAQDVSGGTTLWWTDRTERNGRTDGIMSVEALSESAESGGSKGVLAGGQRERSDFLEAGSVGLANGESFRSRVSGEMTEGSPTRGLANLDAGRSAERASVGIPGFENRSEGLGFGLEESRRLYSWNKGDRFSSGFGNRNLGLPAVGLEFASRESALPKLTKPSRAECTSEIGRCEQAEDTSKNDNVPETFRHSRCGSAEVTGRLSPGAKRGPDVSLGDTARTAMGNFAIAPQGVAEKIGSAAAAAIRAGLKGWSERPSENAPSLEASLVPTPEEPCVENGQQGLAVPSLFASGQSVGSAVAGGPSFLGKSRELVADVPFHFVGGAGALDTVHLAFAATKPAPDTFDSRPGLGCTEGKDSAGRNVATPVKEAANCPSNSAQKSTQEDISAESGSQGKAADGLVGLRRISAGRRLEDEKPILGDRQSENEVKKLAVADGNFERDGPVVQSKEKASEEGEVSSGKSEESQDEDQDWIQERGSEEGWQRPNRSDGSKASEILKAEGTAKCSVASVEMPGARARPSDVASERTEAVGRGQPKVRDMIEESGDVNQKRAEPTKEITPGKKVRRRRSREVLEDLRGADVAAGVATDATENVPRVSADVIQRRTVAEILAAGRRDEGSDLGDSDFGGRLLNRERRELRRIQEARRAAEKQRLAAAVGALQERKDANASAGPSARRPSSRRKPSSREPDVSSDVSFETPKPPYAPETHILRAPQTSTPTNPATKAAADARAAAQEADSRAAELKHELAQKSREVTRLKRVAEGLSRGSGAAERELQAELMDMRRERDGALQERKALLEQLARRDRQLAERCDEVNRLKAGVAKLAEQHALERARADTAAAARAGRVLELEEGLRALEKLRTSAEIELRAHQERQALFAAEKQGVSDALAVSRASEQTLVRKVETLQSQLSASAEAQVRGAAAANAALNQRVEVLLTRVSDLEGELGRAAQDRDRQVASVEKTATREVGNTWAESPTSGNGVFSEGESESVSRVVSEKKTLKWPEQKRSSRPGAKTKRSAESEASSVFSGTNNLVLGVPQYKTETPTNTLCERGLPKFEGALSGGAARLVQSDGEEAAGNSKDNRARKERVEALTQEVTELRGQLKTAQEETTVSRSKYRALLRNLRTWMEGRRYSDRSAAQLTILVPLLAWRNVPVAADRIRGQWRRLVEGLWAESTTSSPTSSFVSRMSRLRQHRRCLAAYADRQGLLAAFRVWRAVLSSRDARAAEQSAHAREQDCERVTRALPWWVRRVSARAALVRFFLHWRLACEVRKREVLEGLEGLENLKGFEGLKTSGYAVSGVQIESVERNQHGRNGSFVSPGGRWEPVGDPSEVQSVAELDIPEEQETDGPENGTLAADDGDAIRTELRRIREMVQERLTQLRQDDDDVADTSPCAPESASDSGGIHTCQSQKDVIAHLITVLTDLQSRVTGKSSVTPATKVVDALLVQQSVENQASPEDRVTQSRGLTIARKSTTSTADGEKGTKSKSSSLLSEVLDKPLVEVVKGMDATQLTSFPERDRSIAGSVHVNAEMGAVRTQGLGRVESGGQRRRSGIVRRARHWAF